MATAALVLAGGGYRCVSQVWWCEELLPALASNGIALKVIQGSSGGALNAVKLAESSTDFDFTQALEELAATWEAIDARGPEVVFPVRGLTLLTRISSQSLLDGSTLWGLIYGGLLRRKPLDVARVVGSRRQLDVFVTNEKTLKKEIISNRDQAVIKDPWLIRRAVVASASIHPFFPPVMINGIPYADGEEISLDRAFTAGCDFIIVLLPYIRDYVEEPGNDFFSRAFPIPVKTFIKMRSKTQMVEQKEVEGALRNIRNLETLDGLREAERTHCWAPWKKAAVDERFRSAPFSFQGKKKSRIIVVYLEAHPRSLKIQHFGKGDLLRIRKPCRDQMKAILKKEGLI